MTYGSVIRLWYITVYHFLAVRCNFELNRALQVVSLRIKLTHRHIYKTITYYQTFKRNINVYLERLSVGITSEKINNEYIQV